MSVQRLRQEIRSLPDRIGSHDIQRLRDAAGPSVSPAEQELVDHFVRENPERLGKKALAQIQKDFGLSTPKAATFRLLDEKKLDLNEASGLAEIHKGLLVIDDEKGLFWRQGGKIEPLLTTKDSKHMAGLEGLCLSSDGKSAYVVSEDSRKVTRVPLEWKEGHPKAGKPEVLGKLPSLGETDNKGWEGIDILPGRFSQDGEDRLVAVHEGSPLRIGIFSLPDLEESIILKLPSDQKGQIRDLSDIAVCPKTGHLFLLSDESSCLLEVALTTQRQIAPGALLERPTLAVVGRFDLPLDKGSKPEGLSFGRDDTLWVASDGNRQLWKFQVERG